MTDEELDRINTLCDQLSVAIAEEFGFDSKDIAVSVGGLPVTVKIIDGRDEAVDT